MPMPRLSTSDLRAKLDLLPRIPLAATPTPLQELRALSRETGVRILVKRDGLTGLAFGGNKVARPSSSLATRSAPARMS